MLAAIVLAAGDSTRMGRPKALLPDPDGRPFVDGELLLKFRANTRAEDRATARAQVNAAPVRTFKNGAEHWKLGSGVSVDQAIEKLRRHPLVEYAEPNFVVSTEVDDRGSDDGGSDDSGSDDRGGSDD